MPVRGTASSLEQCDDQSACFPADYLGSLGALVLVCLGNMAGSAATSGNRGSSGDHRREGPGSTAFAARPFQTGRETATLPSRLLGRILGPELLVLSSSRGIGPGFRIIVPFETGGSEDTSRQGLRAGNAPRPPSVPAPEVRVVGNLLWPDEHDRFFTPEPEGSLWFARDLAAMAGELKTEPVLVVVRESSFDAPNIHRWPVDGADVPNDHFQYAVTWFSLALVWIGMTAFWVRRIIGVHAR